jgi:ribonuclease T1
MVVSPSARRVPLRWVVLFLLGWSSGHLLALPAWCLGFGDGRAESAALSARSSHEGAEVQADPLQKARDLLKAVQERHGVPPPGYLGGREFHNRERRLPRGRYREYDVNPKTRGRPRDGERIVIEQQTGKAYYTGDHYRTFVPLN